MKHTFSLFYQNLLQVSERIPTIGTQLKILSTVKATMFGTYGKSIYMEFQFLFRYTHLSVDTLPRSLSKNERAMICKKKKQAKQFENES